MTKLRALLYTAATLSLLALSYLSGMGTLVARAADNIFSPTTCYTAAATSTLAYMTPGTATTTATCLLGPDGASTAVVEVQMNASSTLSVFNTYIEESMDNQDWYPVQTATTSIPFVLTTRPYATYTFASSTIQGAGVGVGSAGIGVNGSNNRNFYTLDVPVRMRYVRVYTTITGANAGLWMQIVPRQPVN